MVAVVVVGGGLGVAAADGGGGKVGERSGSRGVHRKIPLIHDLSAPRAALSKRDAT